MPLINFPNVPNVPGVPAILRSITVPTPGAILNMALGAVAESIFGRVVWGVYDQAGNEALTPDSFVSIDYKNNMRVSNYPQEEGSFASYNKVGTPYDCRVRMAIGGDKTTRTAFLAKCDVMLKSIDLYTVITPEATYKNSSLENYDYRRESRNGATLLIVDLAFIEVRITAVASLSGALNPSQPSGADPVSGGQVQITPVTQGSAIGVPLPPMGSALTTTQQSSLPKIL